MLTAEIIFFFLNAAAQPPSGLREFNEVLKPRIFVATGNRVFVATPNPRGFRE